jgi:hypothetical protein
MLDQVAQEAQANTGANVHLKVQMTTDSYPSQGGDIA